MNAGGRISTASGEQRAPEANRAVEYAVRGMIIAIKGRVEPRHEDEHMSRRSNEGRTCDAVIRVLEQRSGAERGKIRYPEKELDEAPVELRVPVGSREYALEHTLIEPFPREIEQFYKVVQPISNHLKENLPNGLSGTEYYLVGVPFDAELPSGKGRARALDSLVDWIVETAQRMRTSSREGGEIGRSLYRSDPPVRDQLALLNCEVELRRWPDAVAMGREPGQLETIRIPPEELQEQRRRRLETAFRKKCPKLEKCRARGARTVLVLETDDIALTTSEEVADQAVSIVAQRNDPPDEMFLVETRIDPWLVWLLKHGDDYWPKAGTSPATFHKNELVNVTGERR